MQLGRKEPVAEVPGIEVVVEKCCHCGRNFVSEANGTQNHCLHCALDAWSDRVKEIIKAKATVRQHFYSGDYSKYALGMWTGLEEAHAILEEREPRSLSDAGYPDG